MGISNETVVYTLLGRDQLSKTFKGATKNAALLAGGVLAAGAALVKIGSDFDEAYDTIRVGTGATGKTLEGLKGDFKAVVKDVPADFGSAGKAIADLNTRTGLSGKPLQELSKQFLELSRITGEDLNQSIPRLTRLFGDWSVAAEDQSATMDKLFRASQTTGIGVSKLSELMVQFGSPLRALGLSFDFTTAMFSRFEKEGVNIQTTMPGLRMALKNFAKAGEEPAPALMKTFKAIKDTASEADASTLAFKVFGTRAGPDLAIAIREGRFDLDALMKTIKGGKDTILGAAEDTKRFTEKLVELKNKAFVALEPVAIRVFDAVGAGVDLLTATIGALKNTWDAMPQWMQIGIGAIAGVTVAVILARKAFVALKTAAETAYLKFLLMSRGAKILTASLGVIGAAFAVATVVLEAFGGENEEAKQKVKSHTEALHEQTGALTENSRALAHATLEEEGHAKVAEEAGISQKLLTDAALGTAGALEQLRAKLSASAQAGEISTSEALWLIQAVKDEADAVGQSKDAWERRTEALDEGTEAAEKSKDTTKELSKALQELIDKQNEAAGKVLSSRDAQRRYEEAVDNAREALKENGKTTDITTEKGRRNQDALDGMAKAALDQADAMSKNGHSQETTRKKIGKAREEFIKTARQMGISKEEARKLADKLRLIPGKYKATIDANTKPADRKLQSFYNEWNNKKISFNAGAMGEVSANRAREGRASGGFISGAGGPTSDSIPAWLSNGEYVIRASETKKHRGLLESINAGRFAKGGPITLNASADTSAAGTQLASILKSMMSGPPGLLNFAGSHQGSPYVWGAAGPRGFDCSGWVSALVNHARGISSPYFRLGSTATFPWAGFERGPGRYLSVGSTKNAGNGIGHMAASIGRTPTESAGGIGVRTAGGARGAFDALFGGNVWHPRGMKLGGPVDPRRGDLPFDQLDPRGMRYAKFDKGGQLKPGVTMAVNNTGRNETVIPPGGGASAGDFAKALVRELKANGLTLVAVDSGQRANLLGRAG